MLPKGGIGLARTSRQAVRELGEIGQYARRHPVRSAASSRLFHDPLRSTLRLTGSPFRSLWSAPLPPIVAPNLLKTSPNSLVISVLWQSVADRWNEHGGSVRFTQATKQLVAKKNPKQLLTQLEISFGLGMRQTISRYGRNR
jgi:hypothetical protein